MASADGGKGSVVLWVVSWFSYPSFFFQYGDLGVEGAELWLAASGDQRVSIWASDWLRDRCELLEWLSFPAPAVSEVRVSWGYGWGLEPAQLSTTHCFSQAPGLLPPSLAAFCPWDRATLVCVGLGAHEEVVFYSLRQKQVCALMMPSHSADAALGCVSQGHWP